MSPEQGNEPARDQGTSQEEESPEGKDAKDAKDAKQQEDWHKAYLLQQRRMQCPRGDCGDGGGVF
jgi:hypothetical protein